MEPLDKVIGVVEAREAAVAALNVFPRDYLGFAPDFFDFPKRTIFSENIVNVFYFF